MQINQELFEAWLFAQPREREFNYFGVNKNFTPCCVCAFLLDNGYGQTNFAVCGTSLRTESGLVDFPVWLIKLRLDSLPCTFTAGEVQDRYRLLFPSFDSLSDATPMAVVQTATATDMAQTNQKQTS